MPQQNIKRKDSSSKPVCRRKHLKLFWTCAILLVLLLGGVTAFIISRYETNKAVAADRLRFNQTDSDMQVVVADILKSVPPDKHNYTKSCEYQSRDYSPKPLVCSIVFSASYGAENINEKAPDILKIESLIPNSKYIKLVDKNSGQKINTNFRVPEVEDSKVEEGLANSYIDTRSEMDCTLGSEVFNSYSPPFYYQALTTTKKFTILVTFDCSKHAKGAVYLLKNS